MADHADISCSETDRDPAAEDFGFIELVNASNASVGRSGLELYELWLLHHPSDPLRHAACFNYGVLLTGAGQLDHAVTAYTEATSLAPNFLPAYVNCGLALESLGLKQKAIGQWRHVTEQPATIDGERVGLLMAALRHIARVCAAAGDVQGAEEAYQRILEIDPHQRDAILNWIALRQVQCKWPVISPWGRLARSHLMAAISPMSLAVHGDDPIFHLANAWRHFEMSTTRSSNIHTAGRWVPSAVPCTKRPLRIGYISADLREHAIGFLTVELYELHDRARVEVFAYYTGQHGPDAVQARISQAVDHWADVGGWSARKVAARIVRDEIDILVDLDGHTSDGQFAMIALRPAPVIVNWLGYPGTMGTPHHQYIIADSEIIPPEYEKYYSERVLRLPCDQPTDRKRVVAAPAPSRGEAGLPDTAFVYCCFNAAHKITPEMFRCWMAILARVSHAVLWLLASDAATDERLRGHAVSHGISADRLVFAPRKPNAEHLARYKLADLFLDTSPYGAHTTASDALWMGVPVLTIAGNSFAARVCASLVHAAGLAELACAGVRAYEDLAVELGTHPDRLTAPRDRLRRGSRPRRVV